MGSIVYAVLLHMPSVLKFTPYPLKFRLLSDYHAFVLLEISDA